MRYDAEASCFKPMIPIVSPPVRTSVVGSKCYCASKGSSKPTCIHNVQCICFKTGRDCTNACRCRRCGNKRPAGEGKENRRKRVRHKLVSAWTKEGEDELPLIEPPSKINSFQHCILQSLFFFVAKDCKILFLVVKDFLFIVSMLQKNYDIVVEVMEGKIANTISKKKLWKKVSSSLGWNGGKGKFS